MSVPIGATLGIFADNTRLRKSVLPLSATKATAWARGLNLPVGGKTVLYTGQMYQLMPTIEAMSRKLASYENSWLVNYFGLGRLANRFINVSNFMARANPAEQQASDNRLRTIARLLQAAGVDFGCLYEKDYYAGALTYDEGLDEAFRLHAAMVYRTLKSSGVKRLITVDPHTTDVLRTAYPKVIEGFDIEVKNYLEVLAEREPAPLEPLGRKITIHDSCIYARYENIIDAPRQLLKKGGLRIQEAELSGKLTQCCGGPLESLFPGKAVEISQKRIKQLSDCASEVVTMCPICLANLQREAPPEMTVRDISEYLAEAYLPAR